jgi:hypothetical protein
VVSCGDGGHNGGRSGGHHNGQNGGSGSPIQYTTYPGPQMTVAPAMIIMSEDWKYKLTQAQHDKLKELKIRAQSQYYNHNSTPNSTYNANSTQSQPSQSSPPAPAAPVPLNSLRQMLSNSHSRPPSQVNNVQCTYSI